MEARSDGLYEKINYCGGGQGNTHTETARRLCVSIKFGNDMVRLKRETGSLDLWQAAGHVCNLFTEEECSNLFNAAGYRTDSTRYALAKLSSFPEPPLSEKQTRSTRLSS